MLLPLLLLPIFAGLFWFVVIVPQQRLRAAHQAVVDSLEVGHEIVTASGLYGTVTELEAETARLEIAPGVVVRIDKHAVGLVLVGDAPSEDAA